MKTIGLTPTVDEIVELWCDDLENGNHLQDRGLLCDITNPEKPKYCCLGRLSELAIQNGVQIKKEEIRDNPEINGESYVLYNGRSAVLPQAVKNWAHFKTDNGLLGDQFARSLAGLNDEGMPFPEIAKLIRKHKKDLFITEGKESF